MRHDYDAAHWRTVRAEIARVYRETAFYSTIAAAHPLPETGDPAAIAGWVASLPPVAKKDVRRNFPKGWIPRDADLTAALGREEVLLLSTSGTTEDRVQVLWDAGWWDTQERAAMRLNARVKSALGADPYKEAVLTTPVCAGNICHIGDLTMAERTDGNILFLNQVADPTYWKEDDLARIADEIDAFRPAGIEADPAYLASLSAWLMKHGRITHRPRFLQLTYEFTSSAYASRIRKAFDQVPLQLYGSTECGVLFMECEHGRLHANVKHTHVDLVPAGEVADGAGTLHRVLATTIGRRWMPLVRFDQGDLLLVENDPEPCPCGNTDGPVAKSVEGRVGDLTWTAGKRPVTPGAIDRALAPHSGVDGIAAWQITQETEDRYGAAIVVSPEAREGLAGRASAALATLYGDGDPARVTVRVETVPAILPEASGKYRPSRSEVALGKGTRLSKDRDWLEAAA